LPTCIVKICHLTCERIIGVIGVNCRAAGLVLKNIKLTEIGFERDAVSERTFNTQAERQAFALLLADIKAAGSERKSVAALNDIPAPHSISFGVMQVGIG